MSVYYVHAPETGLVKIGFAEQPFSRLSKMQVDSPTRLILVAVEDGGKAVERERHQQFAELRSRGEWFRHELKLAEHIASLPPLIMPARRSRISGALGRWIVANGHTLESFAKVAGTTQATLSRICDGKQFPRRDLMLRIVDATGWEVDANALLGISGKPRAGITQADAA